eukprot:3032798-Pyramimonas_sp.AAC.1
MALLTTLRDNCKKMTKLENVMIARQSETGPMAGPVSLKKAIQEAREVGVIVPTIADESVVDKALKICLADKDYGTFWSIIGKQLLPPDHRLAS